MNSQVNAVYTDARYFLNTCTKKYSIVLVDVFKAEEQPSHVLTLESLTHLKNNLNDSALLLVNWHGYSSETQGKGTAVLYNTLSAAGFHVKLCAVSAHEDQRNLIFVAALTALRSLPFERHEPLAQTTRIATDNLPLLEKYNALANKAWRANYLRYYQAISE